MPSRIALDTNVLLHLYDEQDAGKRQTAAWLLAENPVVSAQVISEFLNAVRRVAGLTKDQALGAAVRLFAACPIAPATHARLMYAARLLARYDFQLFDAIIVAAALEAGCDTLYSADFQHNQLVEGRLRLFNPFK